MSDSTPQTEKTHLDGTDDTPTYASLVEKYMTSLHDAKMWTPLEKPGQEWARFILGGPEDQHAPHIWFIRLPPNHVTGRHYHNVHRLDLIIEGSYMLEGKLRKAGDITVFKAGVTYGPIVHGPEGSLQMEIFADGSMLDPIFNETPPDYVIKNFARMGMHAKVVQQSGTKDAKG